MRYSLAQTVYPMSRTKTFHSQASQCLDQGILHRGRKDADDLGERIQCTRRTFSKTMSLSNEDVYFVPLALGK